MKVSDVMTKRVLSVSPDSSVLDAARLMLKHRVSGLPVIDSEHKLVGIITESDFLHRAETGTEPKHAGWLAMFLGVDESAKKYVYSHSTKVREAMSSDLLTTTPDTSLEHAVQVMETHNIKRLPVVSRGKVIGIVSRANLARALVSILRAAPTHPESDAAIRDHILKAIAKEDWAAGAAVDVVVRDGIVDLWGTLSYASQREAFRVLAERTAGVKKVDDHLTMEEPGIDFP